MKALMAIEEELYLDRVGLAHLPPPIAWAIKEGSEIGLDLQMQEWVIDHLLLIPLVEDLITAGLDLLRPITGDQEADRDL